MSVIGIAANGDQIVDGKDPSIKMTVVKGQFSNSAQAYGQGLNTETGVIGPEAIAAGGRMVLSDTDTLKSILGELRLMNFYLAELCAGRVVGDSPEMLRADADVTGLLNTLS